MATVAVVAHSRAGSTWRLAKAVCDGARVAEAQVHLIRIDERIVDEADWDMLVDADGTIFGCPTHMGHLGNSNVSPVPRFERGGPPCGATNSPEQGMAWIGSSMKPPSPTTRLPLAKA